MTPSRASDATTRVLRWWLRALSGGLAAAALALSTSDVRRGVLLAFVVLLGFLPFTYARRRLHAWVLAHVAEWRARRLVVATWTAVGMVCDGLMVTQLVLARTPNPDPLLNASPLAWLGPVWFSGHTFLLLGYGIVGLVRLARRSIARRAADERMRARGQAPAISRRGFLRQASVVGVGVPFGVSLSGVGTSYDFQVERREAALPHWPETLDGLRIAHTCPTSTSAERWTATS